GVTHSAGTAVLVVTHNREIARVADRIIELSSGSIAADRPNEPADVSTLRW
ncbi:MAG: ABC transporter ATP-binding protein, partial [Solirubrobacterales bacterium]